MYRNVYSLLNLNSVNQYFYIVIYTSCIDAKLSAATMDNLR